MFNVILTLFSLRDLNKKSMMFKVVSALFSLRESLTNQKTKVKRSDAQRDIDLIQFERVNKAVVTSSVILTLFRFRETLTKN